MRSAVNTYPSLQQFLTTPSNLLSPSAPCQRSHLSPPPLRHFRAACALFAYLLPLLPQPFFPAFPLLRQPSRSIPSPPLPTPVFPLSLSSLPPPSPTFRLPASLPPLSPSLPSLYPTSSAFPLPLQSFPSLPSLPPPSPAFQLHHLAASLLPPHCASLLSTPPSSFPRILNAVIERGALSCTKFVAIFHLCDLLSQWFQDKFITEDNSTCIRPIPPATTLRAPGWGGAYNGSKPRCVASHDLRAFAQPTACATYKRWLGGESMQPYGVFPSVPHDCKPGVASQCGT